MGMSTHVVGFVPRDETWEKYEKVYISCKEAGVEPPAEVMEFFDWKDPRNSPGKEVDIESAVEEYRAEMRDGYTINLSELPKNVTVVRVYNSY